MNHTLQNTKTLFDFSFVLNAFDRLVKYYKHKKQIRKTINELSSLSNRELNDMGISRGDIYAIAHESYLDNRDKVEYNKNLKGWV